MILAKTNAIDIFDKTFITILHQKNSLITVNKKKENLIIRVFNIVGKKITKCIMHNNNDILDDREKLFVNQKIDKFFVYIKSEFFNGFENHYIIYKKDKLYLCVVVNKVIRQFRELRNFYDDENFLNIIEDIYATLNLMEEKDSVLNSSGSLDMILKILGNPHWIIGNFDGQDVYVYFGLHVCKKKKKTYMGYLFIKFDKFFNILGKEYYCEMCSDCYYMEKPDVIKRGQSYVDF